VRSPERANKRPGRRRLEVMENFDAVAACTDATAEEAVTTTGTPQAGAIAVFSGDRASPTAT